MGWCQREHQITPWRLALSLLTGFATQRVDSLADAQRLYNALFGSDLAYKQLAKARFADFMRGLAGRLLDRWWVRALQALPGGAFAEFERIVIQDGSSFKITRVRNYQPAGRHFAPLLHPENNSSLGQSYKFLI